MDDLVDLLERCRKAAAADPALCTDTQLQTGVLALEAAQTALAAAEAALLAELDARGTTEIEHALATGTWLAREAHLPPKVARGKVRTAVKLRRCLPGVADAMIDGRINDHHAAVLAIAANPRIAEAFASIVPQLVDAAEGTVFDVWRRDVHGAADLLDQDGGHDPARDSDRNRLTVDPLLDGVVQIHGTLTGDHAIAFSTLVNKRADALFHLHARDNVEFPDLPIPSRAVIMADALVDLVRHGAAHTPGDGHHNEQPRSEAILLINDTDLSVLTLDRALVDQRTASLLVCDAGWAKMTLDTNGVPLALGRTQRYATAALRLALAVRDGGCIFPGCTAPPTWCDAHHIEHWEHGGKTDQDNMALLCRHHHRRVAHAPGWTMTPTGNGRFLFTSPTGIQRHSQHHGTHPPPDTRAGPAPP